MVHKIKRPLAYRVYIQYPWSEKQYPIIEQRKYLRDAEADKIMILRSPFSKAIGIKAKIKKERADPFELQERKLLRKLGFKKWSPVRGIIESTKIEF